MVNKASSRGFTLGEVVTLLGSLPKTDDDGEVEEARARAREAVLAVLGNLEKEMPRNDPAAMLDHLLHLTGFATNKLMCQSLARTTMATAEFMLKDNRWAADLLDASTRAADTAARMLETYERGLMVRASLTREGDSLPTIDVQPANPPRKVAKAKN